MSSLTGQQINNTYQGLLKSDDNGLIGINRTQITDGVGNNTGLFFWKQYGLKGIDNSDDTTQNPQWIIGNDNFNVANTPMGAFSSTVLSFGDFDEFKTFEINQNRFGSVTYNTFKEGQSHIFTGVNGNSPIRINSFNSINNSNSWFTGYQRSVDALTYDGGTGDLTIGRTDDTDLVVNIPSGGGGGGTPIYNLQQTRPIWSNFGFPSNIVFKTTHATDGYGTQNYLCTAGNEWMAIPFTETTGLNITNFQMGVGQAQPGATVDVYLYKAYVKSITQGGVTQDVLDAEYVAPVATGIDCSTTGEKTITGLSINLPSTEDSTYFFVYKMNNGVNVGLTQWSNTVQISPNNSIQMSGNIAYRIVCWQSGGGSTMPQYLELGTMSASTGSGLIRSLYSVE